MQVEERRLASLSADPMYLNISNIGHVGRTEFSDKGEVIGDVTEGVAIVDGETIGVDLLVDE